MKTEIPGRNAKAGAVALSVVLLALAGCGGSDGGEEAAIVENKGPPSHSNAQGASIDVSNRCELASDDDTGKPVLRVTTTIVDTSSSDYGVDFTDGGTTVRAKEKGGGKDSYQQVGETAIFTGSLGTTVTDIKLCDGSGAYLGPDDTVSLNASVTVSVDNDNKGEYVNRCDDDPETSDKNEGEVDISAAALGALCALP